MLKVILPCLMMTGVGLAGVKSGHAEAELLAATEGYTAGKPLQLGVRLKMDEGWHSYWVNPGEGGMQMSVEWTLPEGWKAGPLQYPVPIRFMTGDLPGFGYEGEVILPVVLTPAEDAVGLVEIGVALSWLTCNDSACVPGDAELKLSLGPGEGKSSNGKLIAAAIDQLPVEVEGASLDLSMSGKTVSLSIVLPEGLDASGSMVFPATPSVVGLGKELRLEKAEESWRVEAPLHEYADGPPKLLELVIAGGGLKRAVMLRWETKP